MKQGQFPAVLPLGSLNGQNGFKLNGEMSGDQSGISVSTAGDINKDGYNDLMIGAWGYPGNNRIGRSYVVFGGSNVGSSGIVELSKLNSTMGFKIDGESTNNYAGYSVSGGMDLNGDGHVDLLIGAYGYPASSATGRSYVIFGGPGIGKNGDIALSNLNGSTGFKLDGESSSDHSSLSVSEVADVNGDGYADLMIGAYAHGGSGRSYVMFGGPGVSSGGIVLSSLNGVNGFKLDGEFNGDRSGISVSAAGDINGDGHVDLLVGSSGYSAGANKGRSYVVFGGTGLGSSGDITLGNLNGVTGFKLDGEFNGDWSGYSVSRCGDINGDGNEDLIIGAMGYPGLDYINGIGRSYVVFGGPQVGNSGLLLLSTLNGVNGFKLDGESINDLSGIVVGGAGDINGDGWGDLIIGASGHRNQTGRGYVVFGGSSVGRSGIITLSDLNGSNGFKLDGESSGDFSSFSISPASDINGDGVADIIIGAYGHNNLTGRSYVVFGDIPPVLVNNSLSLSVGAAIQLNSTYLAAYDRNHNNNTLVFIPTALSHGYFATTGIPNIPVVNFTQQQVISGSIQFVHDGSLVAPSYNITVHSAGIAWTGTPAKIIFIGAPQSYFPAVIPLASLNGQNGFKLDGETSGDTSGYSVSTAGDINGDGYDDLIIGAAAYRGGRGRSYVVFGGPGVGNSGIFSLSSLAGANGFKLDGENNGDYSGVSANVAGDINGDGHDDLIIGAYGYQGGNNKGRSYVVFGVSGIGNGGIFNLSSLNGSGGFKLDGEDGGDLSGVSVSAAGDINGDGYADLVIGAEGYPGNVNKGRSYVVFGGPGVGRSGDLQLSSLNGTNGFKLNGENNGDQSGYSVSAAGDINGDGYTDLVIGAYGYPSGNLKGRSYVVFGRPGVGSSGVFNLSSLSGGNGFKLDGENNQDYSGSSVGIAGDINSDGYADLLIGADCYPGGSNKGRSYVVFGGSGVASVGIFNLSSLDGSNGFKLDGENNGDYSGYPVNAAGDINGDGHADLIIGASGYLGLGHNGKGRSYVVFGGPGVGSNGVFNLSTLTGVSGFKLDGESINDLSGFSVNTAGDINGDGVVDLLIGAYGHNSSTGRSYVVFGDAPPVLVQNRLTIQAGNQVRLNSTYLSAYDRNHNNNTLVFTVSALTHGHFELTGKPGAALSNFTQPQLTNNTVLFIHDGSSIAPSYNIMVRSAGIAWTGPSAANVTFILPTTTTTPIFSTTLTPTMSPSSTITPTTQTVAPSSTTTTSSPSTTVTPSPTTTALMTTTLNPTTTLAPTTSTLVFTSSTTSQPSTTITLMPTTTSTPSSSPITPTPMVTFTPSPTVSMPILMNNQLTLSNGQTVILSPNNLQAVEAGMVASGLIFYVSDVQNGYFNLLPTNASVTRFLQSYVQKGQVQFVHSGNFQAPSYTTVVSDGSQATAPSSALIDFLDAPTVTTTPVTVTPGGTTTLTTRNLNVSNTGGSSPSQIVFQVSNVQQGQFILNSTGAQISNFTLSQLANNNVELTQDSSNIAPSYSIAVTGSNGLSSASIPVTAQLCNSLTSALGCAPRVVRNNLWIKQGASTPLTTQNLYATDSSGQVLPSDTVFYVTNVNHGYFNVNGSSSSYFTQQQLQSGVVEFVDDGTNVAPSYQIAVQSSNLQTNSLAQVTLSFVNKPPYLAGTLPNQVGVVGQSFSLAIGPSTFVDPQNDPLILSAGIYNSTQLLPSWLSFSPGDNRFSGTPTESGVLDIGVTASDPEGLSTVGEFSLTVLGPSAASNNSLTTAIASSVVSGTIGLFFLLLKIGLQRAASKKLEEALGENGEYEQKVVRPVARAIAHRLKITGFMGYTTNHEMLAFKDAVRTLLKYLSERGVNLEDSEMSEIKHNQLINEIATQTKEHFLPSSRNCCTQSCQSFVSFFKAEVTPHQISSAASAIADKIIQNLKQHKSSAVEMGFLSNSQSGMSPPTPPIPSPVNDTTVASLS